MIAGYLLVIGNNYKDSSGNLLTGTLSLQPVLNTGAKTNFRAGQTVAAPAAWSSITTYSQGGVATGADGNAYVSLIDGNIGNVPVTVTSGVSTVDAAHWLLVPKGCFSAGQTSNTAVPVNVTNGAFAVILPDTSATVPLNVGFALTETDGISGACTLGSGYNCLQPTSAPGMPASANSNGVVNFDAYNPNLAPQVTVQIGPQGLQGPPGAAGPAGTTTITGSTGNFAVGQELTAQNVALPNEGNQVMVLGTGTSLPNIRETSTLMFLVNKTVQTGDHAICSNGQLIYDNQGTVQAGMPGYGFLEDGTSVCGPGNHYNSIQLRPWIYSDSTLAPHQGSLDNLGGITIEPYLKSGSIGRFVGVNVDTQFLNMPNVTAAIGVQINVPKGANNYGINSSGSATNFLGGDLVINNTDTSGTATGNTNLYLQNAQSGKGMAFTFDASGNLDLNGATSVQFILPVAFNSVFAGGSLTVGNSTGSTATLALQNNAGGTFFLIASGNGLNFNGSGAATFNIALTCSQPFTAQKGVVALGPTPTSSTDTTTAGIPLTVGAEWTDNSYRYLRMPDNTIKRIAWSTF